MKKLVRFGKIFDNSPRENEPLSMENLGVGTNRKMRSRYETKNAIRSGSSPGGKNGSKGRDIAEVTV